MKRFRPKAWQSLLVLAALAPVFLDGCVSIGVSRSKTAGAEGTSGSLDVTVVEKSGDANPTTSRVVTRLVVAPREMKSSRAIQTGVPDEP